MKFPFSSAGLESPSLVRGGEGEGPAYEMKFLVGEAQAHEAAAWARKRLAPDPHGDPALGGAYRTTTLYFDTDHLDVFLRTPSYGRRKFRLRRYGQQPCVFLERKTKLGDRVRKRRTAVSEEEPALLSRPLAVVGWPGHWFHHHLLARRLRPACQVAYDRTAYVGVCSKVSPLRLTLDRRLRGTLSGEWAVTPTEGGLPFLAGQVILELKFRAALPLPFKELIQDLRLAPSAVSKYRQCMQTWGVRANRGEAVDA